jgi:protein involved in polysaccharide export with SLBB domain
MVMMVLLILTLPAQAQVDPGSNPFQDLMGGGKSDDAAAALMGQEVAPVARTVDAEFYVCGARDVLSLVLTMPMNMEVMLPVSADGSLIVPRIGAVPVAGLTLKQTREKVYGALKKKYASFEGTLSLVQPRPIIIDVQGVVKTRGLMTLTAATPVSIALQMAEVEKDNDKPSAQMLLQGGDPSSAPNYRDRLGHRYFGMREMDSRSLRRVLVQHSDGSVSRADIPMYEATRDGKYDPLLREGDLIIVPEREVGAPSIGIFGAVQRPGMFEFVEGDRISDLVRMGFGVDPAKTITRAELTRESKETIVLDVNALRDPSKMVDTPLMPGDRLFVHSEQRRSTNGGAAIDGEVLTPGIYPIQPGVTKLTDLVQMAGGFTAEAWPGLSEMYRRQTGIDGFALDVAREKDRNFEKSSLYNEDTLYWSVGARVREGQVAVNFHRLFVNGDHAEDVTLEDGDIVLVPRNTGTVYVYGQVNQNGFVPWTEGKDFDWYIERAGGFGTSASEGRAAVIKSNTRAWLDPDDAVIGPGDIIYVPHDPLVRLASTTEVLSVAAAIVGGLAGITGLVIAVMR